MRQIKCLQYIPLIVTAVLYGTSANANFGLSVASGDGVKDITPYRLAASWDFGAIWHTDYNWGLTAIWESSVGFWHGSHGPNGGNDRLKLLTSGPVLRWQLLKPSSIGISPYVELGVGLSWLSRREIGGRKLSLHFQFEDKAGIGIRFGSRSQYDVTYRVFHYSNGSIKRPNSGVNLQMLNLGYWFT